jgi:hypothetical protein
MVSSPGNLVNLLHQVKTGLYKVAARHITTHQPLFPALDRVDRSAIRSPGQAINKRSKQESGGPSSPELRASLINPKEAIRHLMIYPLI